MAVHRLSRVLQDLRLATLPDAASVSDGQLLEQFIEHRDEVAFATLVQRHSRMVWGVCRRIVAHHQDAEDAFQATFLVLARKSTSIRPREMVANWLFGVAHRTALKARTMAGKRREREKQVTTMPEPEAGQQGSWGELELLIDHALGELPDKYRIAIVLCDLEGKTGKVVARQLKIPEGTLSSRLRTARVMLAKRLARHGLTFSGGALATVLSENAASACAPTVLVSSTIKAATLIAAGKMAAAGIISANAAALTEGVLKAMFLTKLKTVMTVLLVLGMVAFGGGLLFRHTAAGQEIEVQQDGHKPITRKVEPHSPPDKQNEKQEQEAPWAHAVPPNWEKFQGKVNYQIHAEATQPSGSPVLLKLIMTNTGNESLSSWRGGPGNYPPLVGFRASVTDAVEIARIMVLSNGASNGGSGLNVLLDTGDSVVIPAMMAPLPKGKYFIQIAGANVNVHVEDDPELLKKREEEIITRIRNGEPFAQHVAATHLTKSLRDRLLQDLSADDRKTALQAATTLNRVEKLSADSVPMLKKAIDKQLTLELSRRDRNTSVLIFLASIAGRIGSEDALEPVLTLVRSELGGDGVVAVLGMFHQDRAVKELRQILEATDATKCFEAARVLAKRNDSSAMDVLIAIAQDPKSRDRGDACTILAGLPHDPRAEPAIKSRLTDSDRSVREQAERAIFSTNGGAS